MKGNRSKDTKPELLLRSAIHKRGFRYRLHYDIQGKPDIVFPSKRVAVFVDGCFWHRCPKCYKEPKTNTNYWRKKISRNQQRAKSVNRQLKRDDWTVMRVWEHEIIDNLDRSVEKITKKHGRK
tara:strand:+ start:1213 stop:1581 length:369 start_codon:yes stop_codon:yes gene_type:complete